MSLFDINEFEKVEGFVDWLKKDSESPIDSVETDSRKDLSGSLFIPIVGERFDGHEFISKAIESGATAICTAKDLSDDLLQQNVTFFKVSDTTYFYQQLAKYHRLKFPNLKVLAITGSCGKTSTKEIAASLVCEDSDKVLKTIGNTNNHIGVPQNLLRLNSNHEFAVLELGTNHFGEIKTLTDLVLPDAAMITCIGGAHLEHFKSRDGVAKEKSTIFSTLTEASTAVVPLVELNRPAVKDAIEGLNVVTFGEFPSKADFCANETQATFHESFINIFFENRGFITTWNLSGNHQAVNAAGAIALVKAVVPNLTDDEIIARLARVQLPGFRGQISEIDGITWINDAYNANAESTISTLNWLKSLDEKGRFIVILGDMLELGNVSIEEHQSVLKFLNDNSFFSELILVGPEYHKSFESSEFSALHPKFYDNSELAKPAVNELLQSGDNAFLKGSRGIRLEKIVPAANRNA